VPGKGLAGVLLLAAIAGCSALASAYGPAAVNSERMRSADSKENVGECVHGRTYDEQRFSPLEQINDGNVDQLGLAWFDDLQTLRGIEGTPLVIDGVLYNTSAFNIVTAYLGATGEKLWTFDPEVNKEWARLACCGPSARGIAAWNGKIYVGALDGRLIAVDANTGKEVWTTRTFESDWPIRSRRAARVRRQGRDWQWRRGLHARFVSAYDAETVSSGILYRPRQPGGRPR
jgi:quinohemoprotein ethanol dehydrogenase